MSMLEDKAKAAAEAMTGQGVDREKAFDPLVLIALLQIILEMIAALIRKNQSVEDALKYLARPSLLASARLRAAAMRIGGRTFKGRPDLTKLSGPMGKALHAVGRTTTAAEMKAVFQEAKLKFEEEGMSHPEDVKEGVEGGAEQAAPQKWYQIIVTEARGLIVRGDEASGKTLDQAKTAYQKLKAKGLTVAVREFSTTFRTLTAAELEGGPPSPVTAAG